MPYPLMACRPGPLRAGRSLRDTWLAFGVGLPLVGASVDLSMAHAEGQLAVRAAPPHAQWARAAALVYFSEALRDASNSSPASHWMLFDAEIASQPSSMPKRTSLALPWKSQSG
jgi:hypothetical protein